MIPKITTTTIAADDKPLLRYPPELAYLLHLFASTLCQYADLEAEGLVELLCAFGEAVAVGHADPVLRQTAANSLADCDGSIPALVHQLSLHMPGAVRAVEMAKSAKSGHLH